MNDTTAHVHLQVDATAAFTSSKPLNDNRPDHGKSFDRSKILLAQVGKLIRIRYGGPCNDDDAEIYYEAALPYLIDRAALRDETVDPTLLDFWVPGIPTITALRSSTPYTTRWARWCTPVLAERCTREWFHEREEAALQAWRSHQVSGWPVAQVGPDGAALGRALRIRADEMRAGDLRLVTPFDRTREELAAERREADRIRKKAARAASGATPREESKAQTRPWAAAGMSRAAWYRRQKPAAATGADETVSSAPITCKDADASVSPATMVRLAA